ncbi:MAG: hypothetical protein M3Y58_01640 [Chloroflexota bacterium]|nr:hypothetical protein [Chloroflexota bacterium]
MARFLDTNILIRYLTNDDPDKAALALALLDRVAEGTEQVVTTPLSSSRRSFFCNALTSLPPSIMR